MIGANVVTTFLRNNQEVVRRYGHGRLSEWSCLLMTPRARLSSRYVVFLVFDGAQADPILAAKVSRLHDPERHLAREAATLRLLETIRQTGGSVPRVVALEEYGPGAMLVETAVVGRVVRRATLRHVDAVGRWLTDLHLATRQDGVWNARAFERLVSAPLACLERALGDDRATTDLIARTRTLASALPGLPLPLVFEHGDLARPNLIASTAGGVGVVDWELAEPTGLPAVDLFFFLSLAARDVHAARTRPDVLAAFHAAFFGDAAWARRQVAGYASRLGIPPPALRPLFVLCWCRYLARRVWRIGPGPLDPVARAWLLEDPKWHLWQHAVTHLDELSLDGC